MSLSTNSVRAVLERAYSRYVIPSNVKRWNLYPSVDIHPTTRIGLQAKLDPGNGTITIGRRCHIHDQTMLLPYGGHITMGDDCTVNPFSILYGHGGLTIGDNVRIAAATVVIPANHNFDDVDVPIHEQGETREGITIEDDVWIGTGARILDGVTIGEGSVIGAGSVVTESIPAGSIAAGVPAKVIRSRHDESTQRAQ
ncbi:DapH/DapD/GlmU-related protein [Haladaptatus sp. DYSN1]|uniref:acyltransferase n=1 Tax=unclassified Haladaptatus TaxID=2622732 RepID=UPI002404ABA5|nr:acyltransferase [Haladaptatus sp. DYSN1]